MRSLLLSLLLTTTTLLCAQSDSIRKPGKLRLGVFTAVSHQLAYNGNDAETNLGNFGFKGYLQPELGLAMRYQADTSEFALVSLSVSRLTYTIANTNELLHNGTTYPIVNRMDLYLNNFSLIISYHKRVTYKHPNNYFSLEAGAGMHVFNVESAAISMDTAAGPYTITRTLDLDKQLFALPSAEIGLNLTHLSTQAFTEFTFGLRGQIYLGKFPEIGYAVRYTSPNESFGYSLQWAPTLITPKAFVLVVF